MSATSVRCLSSGEFVSEAQIACSSCSQMLGSDTLRPSGVGLNSSCGGVSIGDVCMVFCAEGYQAVSNETSTLTCTCDRRDNSLGLSFGVGFSECLFSGRLKECAARSECLPVGSFFVEPPQKIGGRSGESSHCEMPTGTHPDPDGNFTQRHQVEPK